MSSPSKLAFIEIARVLGILVVVIMHTVDMTVSPVEDPTLHLLISPAVRFVVPLFFVISGFVLALHHRSPDYRVDARRFWQRRLRSLVLPFFAWNIVYMFVLEFAQGKTVPDASTLFNLTTGYVHLYYVFVLLQFLLLYTVLGNHMNARSLRAWLLLSALSSIAFYAISDYLLWVQGPDQHWFEWHWGKLGFAWAVFFFWGLWLGYSPAPLEWLRRRQWWLLLAAVCACVPYVLETRAQLLSFGSLSRDYFLISGLPFQFIAATWLLAMLYGLEARMRASRLVMRVAGWGQYVFAVYVAHLAMLVGVLYLWNMVAPNVPAGVEILAVATLTLLVTVAFLRICFLPAFRLLGVVLFGGRGRKRQPVSEPPTAIE